MKDYSIPLPQSYSQQKQAAKPTHRLDCTLCRARDIFFAALGLLLLAPLFAWVALLIKRDTPGPVFYRGTRLGQDGEPFGMLKFRTMVENPEAHQGPRITAGGDPRITPVGKWLRATKINELPQLWNVLVGQMSLVGPRPEDPAIAAHWPKAVRDEILLVKPGVTSPASVLYRDEENTLSHDNLMADYLEGIMPGKLRLDLRYVRSRSWLMDLDILFWTLLVLVPTINRARPPEKVIFWGPCTRLIRQHLNWFAIDGIITFLAFGAASLFLRAFGPLDVGWGHLLGYSLAFTALSTLVGYLLGTQKIYWSKALGSDVVRLLPVGVLVLGISSFLNAILELIPMQLLVLASGLTFLGFVVVRYRSRLLTGPAYRLLAQWQAPEIVRERVLIVGSGDAGQAVSYMINHFEGHKNYQVIGYVDDDYRKIGTRITGADVIGNCGDITNLVAQLDIGVLIFAIHNISPEKKAALIQICTSSKARTIEMPDILGQLQSVSSIMQNIHSMEKRLNGK